jgi:hypothetical protein
VLLPPVLLKAAAVNEIDSNGIQTGEKYRIFVLEMYSLERSVVA